MTAKVTTLEGRSFSAVVNNLTPSTAFVATAQPLAFREDLVLTLLGHSAAGQVVFCATEPRGVVVRIETTAALSDAISQHMRGVPEAVPPPIDADVWRELTNSEGQEDDIEDDFSGQVTADLEPVDREALEAQRGGAVDRATSDVARIGLEQRAATPVAKETPDDAESTPVPRLEQDGYTVQFSSLANYRIQHAQHIEHGGLVVRSAPLTVGIQKMLVLSVPGFDRYTVSARVVFNQPGIVGFMLDSFSLHRDRLRQIAGL